MIFYLLSSLLFYFCIRLFVSYKVQFGNQRIRFGNLKRLNLIRRKNESQHKLRFRTVLDIVANLTGLFALTLGFYLGVEFYLNSKTPDLAASTIGELEDAKVKLGDVESLFSFLKFVDLILVIVLVLGIIVFRVKRNAIFKKYAKFKRAIMYSSAFVTFVLLFSFYGGQAARSASHQIFKVQAQINTNMEGLFYSAELIEESLAHEIAQSFEETFADSTDLWENPEVTKEWEIFESQKSFLESIKASGFASPEFDSLLTEHDRRGRGLRRYRYVARTAILLSRIQNGKPGGLGHRKRFFSDHTKLIRRYSANRIKALRHNLKQIRVTQLKKPLVNKIGTRLFRLGFHHLVSRQA